MSQVSATQQLRPGVSSRYALLPGRKQQAKRMGDKFATDRGEKMNLRDVG